MANSNLNLTLPAALNGASRRNGTNVNDDLIERYVRYVDTLDQATEKVIGDHIATYLNGKAVAHFYRQFYEEYDSIEAGLSPRVEAFVASLFD